MDVTKLETERTKLSQQIEFVIDSLGSLGQEAAKAKLQQLESKLTAVVEQIDRARSTSGRDERPAEAVASEVIANLTKLATTIQSLPLPSIRSLMTALIARLEVDMTTKAIQLDLSLPAWMSEKALCLEDKSVQRPVYQAQYEIRLDSADCSYLRASRTPCFDCRRRRAA